MIRRPDRERKPPASRTSGPGDAVNAMVDDVHMKLVGPTPDRHILVSTSRTIASEVHDVVAAFAVTVLVKKHVRSIPVYRIRYTN